MKPSEVLKNINVEYECSATINTGNFTNVKPSYKVSADVAEDVSPSYAKDILRKMVDGWLEAHVEELKNELNG